MEPHSELNLRDLKYQMSYLNLLPVFFMVSPVEIIMSGWLGTINYGVIMTIKLTAFLAAKQIRA